MRFATRPLHAALILTTLAVVILALVERAEPSARASSAWPFREGSLGVSITAPTSLTSGPDGRLYVASQSEILALTLNASGDGVVSTQQIATDLVGVLGIAFDPTISSPMTLYVSRQDEGAPEGYQGTVSKFVAPDWTREDVITGLPTSAPRLNHWTNGLAFDGGGKLYIAQGSATDAGIADPPGSASYWNETPLSAAILVADVHASGFDGHITYSSSGPPRSDDINQTGGMVSVFAAGTRNPYDLVAHSNGIIYATDNGALGQGTSLDCDTAGGVTSVSDELNLIEQGNYYGAPNRNRGRSDPRQCTYRAPEAGSGPGFTGPIAILPGHCSCDGLAEYTSDAFGGKLRGDLIIAQFIRGDVVIAHLSDDGRAVTSVTDLDTGFPSPLDVAVAGSGAIYAADFTANAVMYLIPDEDTPTPTPTASSTTPGGPTVTPTRTRTPTPTPFDRAGDANCDGSINSIDAALVLQLTAGLIEMMPCSGDPDANGDGHITSIDAALILQYNAGLIGHLPP